MATKTTSLVHEPSADTGMGEVETEIGLGNSGGGGRKFYAKVTVQAGVKVFQSGSGIPFDQTWFPIEPYSFTLPKGPARDEQKARAAAAKEKAVAYIAENELTVKPVVCILLRTDKSKCYGPETQMPNWGREQTQVYTGATWYGDIKPGINLRDDVIIAGLVEMGVTHSGDWFLELRNVRNPQWSDAHHSKNDEWNKEIDKTGGDPKTKKFDLILVPTACYASEVEIRETAYAAGANIPGEAAPAAPSAKKYHDVVAVLVEAKLGLPKDYGHVSTLATQIPEMVKNLNAGVAPEAIKTNFGLTTEWLAGFTAMASA